MVWNVEVSMLWEVCLLILLKVVIEEEEQISCNDEKSFIVETGKGQQGG